MVSQQAASHIRQRVDHVRREHYSKIDSAFAADSIDTIEEVKRGCGRLRSEAEIRELIKVSNKCNSNTYGNFIAADVVFILDTELEAHKITEDEKKAKRIKAREAVEKDANAILDMIYMKAKLEADEVEAAFKAFQAKDYVKEVTA